MSNGLQTWGSRDWWNVSIWRSRAFPSPASFTAIPIEAQEIAVLDRDRDIA